MKKLGIFCAALLALGFASCDDKSDLGIAQVNPQETVMSAGGITVDYGTAIAGNDLDLNQFIKTNAEGEVVSANPIDVIKLVGAEDMPEGGVVSFEMELASKADYSDAITIPVKNGQVSSQAWDDAFRSQLGRGPAAKDQYVRFAAYIAYNGQLSRVGTTDTWFAAKKLNVTPVPMNFVIEDNYYLIGTINGWALDAEFAFNHTDANVYDDPNFTITVEISEEEAAAGWWWKIAPLSSIENNNWDTVIGTVVDGDESLEGSLTQENAKAGCIKEAGTFLVTINLEAMTFSFKKMEYLYTPGNSNGWNQGMSQVLTYNSDKGKYMGFAHLNGEFKFTNQPNWDGTNYGFEADGKLSTDDGAGNLNAAEDGLYWCEVDVENLTYTVTLITSFGAIGDMNAWGAQVPMTPSEDFLVWTGDVTFDADNTFKFRANDDWGINLGGAVSNLTYDGPNLPAPGAGTYTVTVDLTTVPYTCSYKAK